MVISERLSLFFEVAVVDILCDWLNLWNFVASIGPNETKSSFGWGPVERKALDWWFYKTFTSENKYFIHISTVWTGTNLDFAEVGFQN